MDRGLAVVALIACAACAADEPPAAPTWAAHVKPIVDARCVGCHLGPSFRLDSFDDRAGIAGELITEGAGAMAESLAARAATGHGDVDPLELETLRRWAAQAGPFDGSAPPIRPPRGVRPGNRPPTITVAEAGRFASVITFAYRLDDPDQESVFGEARAGADLGTSRILPEPLSAGAGSFRWDTAGVPEGEARLFAILDDGSPAQTVDLGAVEVVHDGGDVPPRVTVYAPAPSSILADADPVSVVFEVVDPDATGPASTELRAVGADATVTIATDLPVSAGAVTEVPWDPTGLPEGSWVVEIEIAGRITRSGAVTVSHGTTTETWASIAPILEARCAGCHTPGRLFDLPIDLGRYRIRAAGEPPGVYDVRGQVHRRAIVLGDMPPPTGPDRLAPPIPLTDDERSRLSSWLRAGAPE